MSSGGCVVWSCGVCSGRLVWLCVGGVTSGNGGVTSCVLVVVCGVVVCCGVVV